MSKIFLSVVLSIFSALPALAHFTGKFHAEPHGAKLNPADTTMLIILICIVVAMIPVCYFIFRLKNKK